MVNLEVIDFHDNRITDIEEDAFEDLTSLKGLDLSLNIIVNVGDTLEPLTSLMKLNLSDNYLVRFKTWPCDQGTLDEGKGSVRLTSSLRYHVFVKK